MEYFKPNKLNNNDTRIVRYLLSTHYLTRMIFIDGSLSELNKNKGEYFKNKSINT